MTYQVTLIIIMVGLKRRCIALARTGRPKIDKPKDFIISIRFTQEEHEKLMKCAAEYNLSITQTIRKGVTDMLESRH